MAPGSSKASPNVERLLFDFAERLEKYPFGWRAVVLNLSRLRPDSRRQQQIRIAAHTFEALVKHFEGRIFVLQQGDIVFICKDADLASIDSAVDKVRFLFGDDPLAVQFDDVQTNGFSSWYDLAREYTSFSAYVQKIHDGEQRRRKRLAAIAGESQKNARLPMEPKALTELVNTISRADLTNVLRRQAVCAIAAGGVPKPVYREVYISIPDLRDAVMPQRDIASDRWLFQYLTQILDRRMLSLLKRNDDSELARSFSLNLNVSTLLSPDFQSFDENLRSGTRGSVVIELEKVDIFQDLGAYVFARDYVHERGYRICLDGVTALTLPFIDRERLGLDLVKMFWSPELGDGERATRANEVRSAIERVGKSRIILARCDGPEAVRFGFGCGVRLFQGRFIDRILANAGNVAAAPSALPEQLAASS